MIINQDTLQTLDLSNVTVLDCRNVMDQPAKTAELLETEPVNYAVHIPENPFMFTAEGINNGRHPLPYKEIVEALFNTFSEEGKSLLLISDEDSFYHTRLYYLFNLYGFSTYLYIGSVNELYEYKDHFTPFHGTLPSDIKGHTMDFKRDIHCSMKEIQQRLQNDNVLLIDVRSNERYKGITEPIDFKKGHIPGAVNIPNPEIYKDGLLDLHALDDRIDQIRQYDEVIVYCGSGMSATPLFTVLDYNDVNVKLYSGSFSEWITEDTNEIETVENTL